ncbi:MAG: DUF4145 domain-containing protein [Anaerolineae bacterium]|nr:DUF4145 domain-containing protein [Anaerolineae bacterium]
MKTDQQIIARLGELITEGETIIEWLINLEVTEAPSFAGDFVDVCQWGTSCLSTFEKVFGADSLYHKKFYELYDNLLRSSNIDRAMGILKAAHDDYQNGLLLDRRILIEAEVFDDFLEQAEYLLQGGYYQPAAVVAGSVLEDGLRKLCVRQSIPLPDKPKLDLMNANLAKTGLYNKLIQKQITAIAELRNQAAHGRWDTFSYEDVDLMLRQVRHFMETHF